MAKRNFHNEFTYMHFLEANKEYEFDAAFSKAIEKVYGNLGKEYPLIIGGQEVKSEAQLEEHSPIDGRLIGRFQKGNRDQAIMAIDAAKKAFDSWREINYKQRASIIRTFSNLLARDKFELAAMLSIENGKSRYESIGEVDEAIDFARYYANEIEANRGYVRYVSLPESKAKVMLSFQGAPSNAEKVKIILKPYGVFGVIAPFNFPISISTGMSIGAIITGNTVVFKPSSTDNMSMLTGYQIYLHLKEAGLPDGV
ncbi:MAG: aldehyde dehydrogenase family protein, partial [Candidatus Micrarchaeaceae archaeon]